MNKGKIIYLNGMSASGKSTLAETLQERLNEPFYWVAQDIVCSLIFPKKFWAIKGHDAAFFEALSLLFNTVKLYSDLGINSIVDVIHNRDEDEILNESLKLLHDYPVLFVHVNCPSDDELRRRKTERGDPNVDKWVKHGLENFEPKEPYDIIVNTYDNTPEECADKIAELLDYPEKFKAFKTLWLQRAK